MAGLGSATSADFPFADEGMDSPVLALAVNDLFYQQGENGGSAPALTYPLDPALSDNPLAVEVLNWFADGATPGEYPGGGDPGDLPFTGTADPDIVRGINYLGFTYFDPWKCT